jgi:galactitol-specific phosphotransferase system IIB component
MAVGDSIGHNIKSENLVGLDNIINGSDIFIFNLEGVLVDSVENIKACEGFPSHQSIFVSNSSFVNYLKKLAPVTIANLANNHIFDCSSEGVKETKRVLTENSILSVGAGQDLHEACEPLVIQDLGLAFVSYNFVIKDLVSADTHHGGAATLDACNHDYNSLKVEKGVDLIIASIHLGKWSANIKKEQVEIIQNLFDSGADIVIGHSPHIPQAIMATKDGRLAFFSLGNFIFRPDYRMPSLAHTTIVPKIDLYTDGSRTDVTIYPVRIDNDGIPHIIEEEDRNSEIISRIAEDSKEFNTFINVTDSLGHISVYRHYN